MVVAVEVTRATAEAWPAVGELGLAALVAAADLGHHRVLLDVGDHHLAAQRLYTRAGVTSTGRVGALPPAREHVTEHELGRDLDGHTSAGVARPVEG